MRFDGKVFLVTGGGRGIGRAIAGRLVEDGARVCLVDSDAHAGRDVAEEFGAPVRFERGSVAREVDHPAPAASNAGRSSTSARPDEAGFVTGALFVQDGGMTRKMIYR